MAVASNPLLLQLGAAARAASATGAAKPAAADTDSSPRFADLYARQNHATTVKAKADPASVAARETAAAPASKAAGASSTVADSGKKLPVAKADKPEKPEKIDKADKPGKADKVADKDDDKVTAADDKDDSAVASTTAPVDSAAAPVPADPASNPALVQAPPAALTAASLTDSDTDTPSEDFDPTQDVLADLPALRLALEQTAKNNGTTSAHASQTSPTDPSATNERGLEGSFVNGLAAMMGKEQTSDAGEGSDAGFAGLLDSGLKDPDAAASDSHIDSFADRLQALTQAAPAKTGGAAPLAGPLGQPLAMQQSGWTEGLVNRVMYLSSQNLKSADIQLTPAELGRLDIRVDITPDQQTQVTFSSAHIGVREALESQQHRLKACSTSRAWGSWMSTYPTSLASLRASSSRPSRVAAARAGAPPATRSTPASPRWPLSSP
ncbi:flagellar hook-length control protein FliK [Pseudomonas sp. RIT-PI-a]|uniref:flagellar hook-length control protein FliK n=1 Tax=Pseudomonas sp. RIT-PI-a TaxID=1681194 RepID=UPI000675FF24|nr:flagellar hook-length control protein FliK [Pseudomonas sp. RIT-PI-a]